MSTKLSIILGLIFFTVSPFSGVCRTLSRKHEHNSSSLYGFKFQDPMRLSSVSSSTSNDCGFSSTDPAKDHTRQSVKLQLRRREIQKETKGTTTHSVVDLIKVRDLTRIQTLHARVKKAKKQKNDKVKKKITSVISPARAQEASSSGQLVATLESGSDLNWLQCLPCYDCFHQNGAFYDPETSSSFKNITCNDPRCSLISSPDPPVQCESDNQSCPYFYWYGDRSNTTGDLAVETFTVNLTTTEGRSSEYKVEDMMFGCGHWNRGLFSGASGLLGLGRGPLSFSSQLQSLYGHSFSYCLVDRNSDTNVSSKLIFGEDKDLLNHPNLNFTSFVNGKESTVETFYYVQIKSILVSGEPLDIPEETWNISSDGAGGTIIDSGTTLSYFAEPAYEIIKEKFAEKVKEKYQVFRDFPILDPCFNLSGVEENNFQLPELGIAFTDGAVWNFPVENSFIWLSEELVCLAILGTPKSAFSIIGNYQQQNFHILYDTKRSRLGFAPTKCADI
ncbi:Aspartic proteinase nepenthesin-2 [Cardamine amara subsp. amara]|uniref:Aspartic proteinase nepenthesin-2 n=1 Tax=Cardamine amara subsp. amara TaxID=228776 RepID=A0ABD0ZIV1_CARAN